MPKSDVMSSDSTGEFEAVTDAEFVAEEDAAEHDTIPPDSPAPDTAPLELAAALAAAIAHPSAAELMPKLEAAMAATARTEAALADLLRTAKFLAASISALQTANKSLMRDLEHVCAMVDGDGAQRTGLERRIQRLERVLDETAREAASERDFLVSDHDAFIATLMSDHEREITSLRKRLEELGGKPTPKE